MLSVMWDRDGQRGKQGEKTGNHCQSPSMIQREAQPQSGIRNDKSGYPFEIKTPGTAGWFVNGALEKAVY